MELSRQRSVVEPVAIIGMACRLPGGADSPDLFWQQLVQGKDAISEVPRNRWDLRKYYDPSGRVPGRIITRYGGFLRQDITAFDPAFFGISPIEAESMDPQQRLLLEVAWEAFESAGQRRDGLAGSSTGVFVGGFLLDNFLTQLCSPELFDSHSAVNVTLTILSSRIANVLDLRGPCLSIDTACSSSLTALHYAISSLRRGDCHQALVAGVNIIFRPEISALLSQAGLLAAHGRCRAFDAQAAGYVRGEGAGAVIIKPLARAQADGDRIDAVIIDTGVNQDGRTLGVSQPNPQAQRDLLRAVYARAGVSPSRLVYVEAHGTGTQAGDRAEVEALADLLGEHDGQPCWLGSAKTAVGHLEAASGVTGLLKAVLVLQHRQVPANLHFERENPALNFGPALRVPTQIQSLPASGDLVVGVSSFGYGGSNAHVILGSGPDTSTEAADEDDERPKLFAVSASSNEALSARAQQLHAAVASSPGLSLKKLASTLAHRSSHHPWRLAIVARNRDELSTRLEAATQGYVLVGMRESRVRTEAAGRVAFIFSGMGPQRPLMGCRLYEKEPAFRAAVDECDRLFLELCGWSVVDELRLAVDQSRIHRTDVAQPANFVIQVGLTALLNHHGIRPAAVLGHSVGEVAAAWAAGALSLEQAVRVVYERSRLQKRCAALKGGMLAVGLSEEACRPYLGDAVSIAAVNGPESITLSGDKGRLYRIAADLEARAVFCRPLGVEVAYHSAHLDGIAAELKGSLAGITPRAVHTPMYSTAFARQVNGDELCAEYWWHNARQPVRFCETLQRLLREQEMILLEIAPHPVLRAACQESATAIGYHPAHVSTLRRDMDEEQAILDTIASAHVLGVPLDLRQVAPPTAGFIRLPAYPWQRERYWRESWKMRQRRLSSEGRPACLDEEDGGPLPAWDMDLTCEMVPFVWDHRVGDRVVVPGAFFIEAGLWVARERWPGSGCRLSAVQFAQLLPIEEERAQIVRSVLDPRDQALRIFGGERGKRDWQLHAAMQIEPLPATAVSRPSRARASEAAPTRAAAAIYRRLAAVGLAYGPSMRTLRWLKVIDARHFIAGVALPDDGSGAKNTLLAPALLDGCLQAVMGLVADDEDLRGSLFLPARLERLEWYGEVGASLRCYGEVTHASSDEITCDLEICNEQQQVMVTIAGLQYRRAGREASVRRRSLVYAPTWEPMALAHEAPAAALAHCLVLSGDEEAGHQACAALHKRGVGHTLIHAKPGSLLGPKLHEALSALGAKYALATTPLGVLDLLSLGVNPEVSELAQACEERLAVVRHLLASGAARHWRLVLGGEGLYGGPGGDPAGLPWSVLPGLAQVISSEQPSLSCRVVDLGPGNSAERVATAVLELMSATDESDVRYDQGERLVLRWGPIRDAVSPLLRRVQNNQPVSLEISDSHPARLCLARRRPPACGEVEIRVEVVDATRLINGGPCRTLAMVGTLVASGASPGVALPPLNTRVVCLVPGAPLQSFVTMQASSVLGEAGDVREALDAAARIEALFLVDRAARLGPRDVVVIDEIAQDLLPPLAELAAARAKRVTVICRPEQATSLGATPRGWQLQTATDEAALVPLLAELTPTCVLSAALGQRRLHLLAALQSAGQYVDLSASPLTLAAVRSNASYVHADFLAALTCGHDDMQRLFEQARGEQPSSAPPASVVTVSELDQLRAPPNDGTPARRTHVAFPTCGPELTVVDSTPVARLRRDATYLVTGGTSGFGLRLGLWLGHLGVARVVLVSRRGDAAPELAEVREEWRSMATEVVVRALDVTHLDEVEKCIADLAGGTPPLCGIFHAATLLADAPIEQQTVATLAQVLAPKALGAWHLHEASLGIPTIEHFVLFSSVSALVGQPGQSNYVAANAFLDALAHQRRGMGLPALSVNWGAIRDTGVLARDRRVATQLDHMGIRPMSADLALECLGELLGGDSAQVAIADIDWPTLARGGRLPSRLAALIPADAHLEHHVRDELLAAAEPERADLLCDILAAELAAVLRCPPGKLDRSRSLKDLGLDSLMTLELGMSLHRRIGVTLSNAQLLAAGSLEQIARELLAAVLS